MTRRRCYQALVSICLAGSLVSLAQAGDCLTGDPPAGQCPANPVPQTHGEWEGIICWDLPYEAIHMILLKTGKVLCIAGTGFDPWLIDPNDPGTIILLQNSPQGGVVECSGHCQLSDGRVFFAGGGGGYGTAHAQTRIFDPQPENPTWTEQDAIPTGKRWYPTCTTTDRGHILIVGGVDNDDTENSKNPLLFDASKQPGQQQFTELEAEREVPWYPFTFQLPDGDFLMGGSHFWGAAGTDYPVVTATLDTTIERWTSIPDSGPVDIKGSSAAMLAPGKILKAGGSLSGSGFGDCGNVDLTDRVQTINMAVANPVWQDVAPMNHARTFFYLVMLPDGKVMAMGGCAGTGPVFVPEMYDPDPAVDTWKDMACMDVERSHHASALLLPDGRILVAGGDGSFGFHYDAQIFKPPYLFQGTRPVIETPPAEINYNTLFKVTVGSSQAQDITGVSLIRLGAATHWYDHDQRFMRLNFVPDPLNPDDRLKVSAPPHAFAAPPGYYMLFILDDGVPSIAKIVKVAPAP